MESKTSDSTGAFKWLIGAGAAAIALSIFLFWADNTVMGGAAARDRHHAEQMRELRTAQASLPSRVTDDRQTLPLSIEGDESDTYEPAAH
jgi:hypothetical protein